MLLRSKCPALKILVLHDFMPHESSILIPKLISKWKNLEVLSLRWSYNMADIIPQIGFHCKKFVQLNAPNSIIGKDESSAMVTFVPNIRHLFLKGSGIKQENLVIILQGCKELVSLDVSDCIGFKDDDAEILQLASHIPAFVCEGSRILIPQKKNAIKNSNKSTECFQKLTCLSLFVLLFYISLTFSIPFWFSLIIFLRYTPANLTRELNH
ncbi:unnamed protein product, partial [Vitis vinifera]